MRYTVGDGGLSNEVGWDCSQLGVVEEILKLDQRLISNCDWKISNWTSVNSCPNCPRTPTGVRQIEWRQNPGYRFAQPGLIFQQPSGLRFARRRRAWSFAGGERAENETPTE